MVSSRGRSFGVQTIARPHSASGKNQSRRTRAGSVRPARHAGNRQAKIAVVVITAKASPNTRGCTPKN